MNGWTVSPPTHPRIGLCPAQNYVSDILSFTHSLSVHVGNVSEAHKHCLKATLELHSSLERVASTYTRFRLFLLVYWDEHKQFLQSF